MSFFTELKRRNVIRVAGLYLVGAWLLIQVASTMLPAFDAPIWLLRGLIITLAVCFIPALIFSWVFELTPQGLKRDEDVKPEDSIAPQTARRMDRLLIVVLVLALAYFCFDKFVLTPRREAAMMATATVPNEHKSAIPEKSIAVLPFENLSDDKANAYFVSGMQDMILTELAAIGDLKVISRMSTERYKSHPENLRAVAQQLGVAHILEGSVQKAEQQVLINVQLIDAATDNHLWAEAYPRTLDNVFGVEGEVAQRVADALKAKLLPAESARVASVPTKNPAALEAYLKARYLFANLQTSVATDPVSTGKEARELYRLAIAADPDFALAYSWASYLESYLHWYGVENGHEAIDAAQRLAAKALALQPQLPEAHLAQGYYYYWCHREYDAALREFATAQAGLPNDAQVFAAIGYVLRRRNEVADGIAKLKDAIVIDPRDPLLPREIGNSYTGLREYEIADGYYRQALAIAPDDMEALEQQVTNEALRGHVAIAQQMLARLPVKADPQGAISHLRFRLAMLERKPDEALAALANAPDWLITRFEHSSAPIALLRGQALQLKKDAPAARTQFLQAETQLQSLLTTSARVAEINSYLALTYAGLGEREKALQAGHTAVQLLPISRDLGIGVFQLDRLARVEAQTGETDACLQHLQQLLSVAAGAVVSIPTLQMDPVWDGIRGDPRFQELLKKKWPNEQRATP